MTRTSKGILSAFLVLTVFTASVGVGSFAANTKVSAIDGITATLTGSLDNSDYAYYGADKTNKNIQSTTASVTSNGDYVITWTISGSATTVDYLYLDLSFPTPINTQPILDTFPNLSVSVTEIKTGSTIVDYQMGAAAVNYDYLNGGLDSVRVTICDQATSNNGYLPKTTAIGQSLSVTFHVEGLTEDAVTPTTTTTAIADPTMTTTIATTLPGVITQAPVETQVADTATAVAATGITTPTTPTQTADLSVEAIVIGGIAAISLAGAAVTVTRRKKE